MAGPSGTDRRTAYGGGNHRSTDVQEHEEGSPRVRWIRLRIKKDGRERIYRRDEGERTL